MANANYSRVSLELSADEFSTKFASYLIQKNQSITEKISFYNKQGIKHKKDGISSSGIKNLMQVLECKEEDINSLFNKLGIRNEDIVHLLDESEICHHETLTKPNWLKVILRAVDLAPLSKWRSTMRNTSNYPQYLLIEEELPFEALFIPFIEVASTLLNEKFDSFKKLINENAYNKMLRQLHDQIFHLAWRSIYLEYHLGRSDYYKYAPPSEENKTYVNIFESDHLSSGFYFLFKQYPVLAKLIGITICNWVDSLAEFFERVVCDSLELCNKNEPEMIVSFDGGVADRHNNGRSTIIFSFIEGKTWVYKPRPVKGEVILSSINDWYGQKDLKCSSPYPLIIDKVNYGWIEFIKGPTVFTEFECQEYYFKAGVLIFIAYLLGTTDCHFENVIATPKGPILIDAETILYPSSLFSSSLSKETQATSIFMRESVLRSGLLPRWEIAPDGISVFDISGLGGYEEHETMQAVPVWSKVNTDLMEITRHHVKTNPRINAPRLETEVAEPHKYIKNITEGFKTAAHILIKNKKELLSNNSLLENMQNLKVRFVFRATNAYYDIFTESLSPHLLKSGLAHSISLFSLFRTSLRNQFNKVFFNLIIEEVDMLEKGDIPYFQVLADEDNLRLNSGKSLGKCFLSPPFQEFLNRVKNLDHIMVEEQINLIQASFAARAVAHKGLSDNDNSLENLNKSPQYSPPQIIEIANKIAHELEQHAFSTSANSLNWLGLGLKTETRSWQLEPLQTNLYDGTSGIALFFAALANVSGDSHWKRVVERSLYELLNREETKSLYLCPKKLGGISGIGSEIYSLCKISTLLQDERYLIKAEHIAKNISQEEIFSDKALDIVEGIAGLLLALLELYDHINQDWILLLAISCGKHLVNTSQKSFSGLAWCTAGGKLLTGFSHGVAGISFALVKLYHMTNNKEFLDTAFQALQYERDVFSEREQNWPDFREEKSNTQKQRFMLSWCHGAPGIGLARLGCLKYINDPIIINEIEIAVRTTLKSIFLQNSDVCCGNIGQIEFLFNAASFFKDKNLSSEATRRICHIAYMYDAGKPVTSLGGVPVYNPTFFKGIAGIGYHLLKAFYPQKLPEVLLLG